VLAMQKASGMRGDCGSVARREFIPTRDSMKEIYGPILAVLCMSMHFGSSQVDSSFEMLRPQ
jgi:hypothetical protein